MAPQASDAAIDPAPPPAQPQPQSPALPLTPPVPDAAEAHRLAAGSFMMLANAIKTKDFAPLYQAMAPSFRQASSLQRVADGFRPFTENAVDLTTASPKLLVVTPSPRFDEHGVLIIRGFEPTPVQTWSFEFGFLREEPGWALTSLSLSSAPASAGQ